MELSAGDLLAIHNLIADYVLAVDDRDIERFSRLWMPDAVLRVNRNFTGLEAPLYGREAIVAAFGGWFERNQQSEPGTFMRHFCANPRLELRGEEIHGETAMLSVGQRLAGERFRIGPAQTGLYTDRFVRVEAGWRFAERLIAWDPQERDGVELPVELYGTVPPADA